MIGRWSGSRDRNGKQDLVGRVYSHLGRAYGAWNEEVDRFEGDVGDRIDRIWWLDIGNEKEGRELKDLSLF